MFKNKFILEKVPKFLLIWFVLDFLLLVVWLSGSNTDNKAIALSSLSVGLVSFLFYEESRRLTNWLAQKNRFKFIKFLSLGLAGALVVELIFWFWSQALGTLGVVNVSGLFLDLRLALPFYFFIVISFWFIQYWKNYPLSKVFILGGVYGLLVEGLMSVFFNGGFWFSLVMGLTGLPIFMVTYSLVLFPPAIFLKSLKS